MYGRIIPVLTRSETARVRKEDIVYIESQAGGVAIHTDTKTYCLRVSLHDMAQKLGKPFYRCHSGYIVNFEKLCSASGNTLHMEDGSVIFLGRSAYQATRRSFIEYLEESHGLLGSQKWLRGGGKPKAGS
jgi:DNA-binding LytR/AlgR family response regulator